MADAAAIWRVYEALGAEEGARVVALVGAGGRVLADVRTGVGRREERRLVREDGTVVAAVDPVLAEVPALVGPLRRLVRVRERFDLRWLDKGTPVEPHPVTYAAFGDRVAVHVEPRDHKTGRVVPGRKHGVLLVVDDDLRIRRWRPFPAFADAVHTG